MNIVADAPPLADRLTEARLTVEALENANGVATLDGRAFDHTTLSAARANVEAIEAAALEAERRDAAAQSVERAAKRAHAAQEAREALSAYSDATKAAEAATKALTDSLAAMLASAKTMARSAIKAGGKPITAVEEQEVRRTVSRLMIGEMVRVGHPSGFGDLKWPSVPKGADWTQHIAKFVAPAIEAAIQRGETHV